MSKGSIRNKNMRIQLLTQGAIIAAVYVVLSLMTYQFSYLEIQCRVAEALCMTIFYNIEVDFDSWKNGYALPHNVHPYVIKYLTYKPSSLHTQVPGSEEMVFATPRSWVRVSDILCIDSDVTKDVIKNKIIGNIGEAEAKSFITFCQSRNSYITVEDMLRGSIGPSNTEQAVTLIDSLMETVKFTKRFKELSDLKDDQRRVLDGVISAILRFPNNEHKMLGLRKLLTVNRNVVKAALYETDGDEITEFIRKTQRSA